MTISDFLSRLQGVKGHAPRWRSFCPVHQAEGRHSTLTLAITDGDDGKILLKCFAGCSPEAIVEKLGLTMRDLFAERAGVSTWDRDQADRALRQRGLRPETIAYFHITADLKRQAWAFPLGRGRPTKFKAFDPGRNGRKYWNEQGATLGVYHLAPCRGQAEAWLVEGEPDTWIAHQAGVPAFSLTGGAGNINESCVADILRAKIGLVHVLYDRDDSGREGAAKVAEALAAGGQTVTVRELPADVGPGGDVTTLYNNLCGNDAAFRAALAALPMRSVGGPETMRERNARIGEAARATLREVQQVASWPWGPVGRMLGGLVAGWMYLIGALTGNGKTTFVLNVLNSLWEDRIPTLYFGTEMPAEDLVKKWAAFRLGFEEQRVFEGKLHDEEREALEREITRLTEQEIVTFSTEKRLDLTKLASEIRWAFDARTGPAPRGLMLDHVHRMSQDREELEQIAKELKEIATERRVALLVAAQLNRDRDLGVFDYYTPPSLSRFKTSGALAEESDVAIGLCRVLRSGMTMQQRRAVQHGEIPITDFVEPNMMAIACLKHRFRGSAVGQFVRLALRGSKLESPSFIAQPPSNAGDAWESSEREEGGHAPF